MLSGVKVNKTLSGKALRSQMVRFHKSLNIDRLFSFTKKDPLLKSYISKLNIF